MMTDTLSAAERDLLELLRGKPQPFNDVAGSALDALMLAGLARWEDADGKFFGWRKVRITEAGRSRLDRETAA